MGLKRTSLMAVTAILLFLSGSAAQAQSLMEKKFLAETDDLYAKGKEWYDDGYRLQADWYYAQAVVAVQSFKYAIANIALKVVQDMEAAEEAEQKAALKAELDKEPETVDESMNDVFGFDVNAMLSGLNKFAKAADKMADKMEEAAEKIEEKAEAMGFSMDDEKEARDKMWNILSGFSIVSPYPFFFEGLVENALGNKDEAAAAFRKSFANPYMIKTDLDFRFLDGMELPELRALYSRLDVKYTQYIQGLSLSSSSFERDWRNFNDDWLVTQGLNCLTRENPSISESVPFFDAAVCANPFLVDNFILAASIHICTRNYERAAEYINEGLLLDPNNKDLKEMVNDLKK